MPCGTEVTPNLLQIETLATGSSEAWVGKTEKVDGRAGAVVLDKNGGGGQKRGVRWQAGMTLWSALDYQLLAKNEIPRHLSLRLIRRTGKTGIILASGFPAKMDGRGNEGAPYSA